MKEKLIIETAVNVKIWTNPLSGIPMIDIIKNKDYVRFTIQPGGDFGSDPDKFFVFDHRPLVIDAAKKLMTPSLCTEKLVEANKILAKAREMPAKIILAKNKYNVIHFYVPADTQRSTMLYFETAYRTWRAAKTFSSNKNVRIEINNAIWSWKCRSSFKPIDTKTRKTIAGSQRISETVLVALTDKNHKIIMKGRSASTSLSVAKFDEWTDTIGDDICTLESKS